MRLVVYLKPRERVWWLQMSSYFCWTKSKNWSKCSVSDCAARTGPAFSVDPHRLLQLPIMH